MDLMWVDQPGADSRIAAMRTIPGKAELADRIDEFRRDGYTVLRGAVSHAAIDEYIAAFDKAAQSDMSINVSYGRDVYPIAGQDLRKPLLKVLDTLVKIPSALPLAFAPALSEFLTTIFDEAPLAFQSLHFEVGSTQAIHQDTAYVVTERPNRLAAAWIALEDIHPGTGELVYYPGSHKFGPFLYPGGKKHWSPEDDGNAIHDHHLHWLHETAREQGVKEMAFLPKKGDVLIWHADLAHGGGKITDPNATRRSFVVHYTGRSVDPFYFRGAGADRRKKVSVPGGAVSSMYYDVNF